MTKSKGASRKRQGTRIDASLAEWKRYCRPGNPLQTVYHPHRLKVLKKCAMAMGIIRNVKKEADGDLHVLLDLDKDERSMLNAGNMQKQHGYLVTEVEPVDQAKVKVPSIGAHVMVVGPWVYDREHGWNEIHPVWHMMNL